VLNAPFLEIPLSVPTSAQPSMGTLSAIRLPWVTHLRPVDVSQASRDQCHQGALYRRLVSPIWGIDPPARR
jgi:hypothetical protein